MLVASAHFSANFLLSQRLVVKQGVGYERFSSMRLNSSKGAAELPQFNHLLKHTEVCMKFLCPDLDQYK